MAKRWVLSAPDHPNPLKGKNGRGLAITVYDKADLNRRLKVAKANGIRVTVRELKPNES